MPNAVRIFNDLMTGARVNPAFVPKHLRGLLPGLSRLRVPAALEVRFIDDHPPTIRLPKTASNLGRSFALTRGGTIDTGSMDAIHRLARTHPIIFILPLSQLLVKRGKWPKSASRHPDTVTRVNLPSFTPFDDSEVHLRSVSCGAADPQSIYVETRLILRSRVAEMEAALPIRELTPDYLALGDEAIWLLDLGTAKTRRMRHAAHVDHLLFLFALALCAFVPAINLHRHMNMRARADVTVGSLMSNLKIERSRSRDLDTLAHQINEITTSKRADRTAKTLELVASSLRPQFRALRVTQQGKTWTVALLGDAGLDPSQALRTHAGLQDLRMVSVSAGSTPRERIYTITFSANLDRPEPQRDRE